jgi:hypothetical protein
MLSLARGGLVAPPTSAAEGRKRERLAQEPDPAPPPPASRWRYEKRAGCVAPPTSAAWGGDGCGACVSSTFLG